MTGGGQQASDEKFTVKIEIMPDEDVVKNLACHSSYVESGLSAPILHPELNCLCRFNAKLGLLHFTCILNDLVMTGMISKRLYKFPKVFQTLFTF